MMNQATKAALTERIQKLLNTPKQLLRSMEKQEAFLGAQALRTPPCPHCRAPVSQLDAADDTFTLKGLYSDNAYACPHCSGKLMYVLPFLGGGWHWWPRVET